MSFILQTLYGTAMTNTGNISNRRKNIERPDKPEDYRI
jgi:hypothetical protein